MNRSSILPIAATALLLAAGACSTTAEDADPDAWRTDARLGEQVDRICFSSSIDNFREADRRTVIVEKGVNDEYLIETMGNCYNLKNAMSLSLDTFGGSSCIGRGDSIYAYDSAFGPDETDLAPVRCPISAIYEWDEDALDQEDDMDGEE
ncbi:MAG: DUF6491 family protein [Henriciella sp.]|uniref:DUF6491 family protein n=1 Tax=Henriciella sp. TaxID=1968823 RepID=UPI003C795790